MEKPLVSFLIFAYNQEQYIQEAIEGAFSQTYMPMEIIISDDCSQDGTFEIIKELVDKYQGPHKTFINCNEHNLGLGGHIRKVANLVNGEIAVMAAGDDISHPQRVYELVSGFEKYPNVMAVCSDFDFISESGQKLEMKAYTQIAGDVLIGRIEISKKGGGIVKGASYAYKRQCFFWPWVYPEKFVIEDKLLPLRAVLLGGQILFINKPLLSYRVIKGKPKIKIGISMFGWVENVAEQILTTDAALESGLINEHEASVMKKHIKYYKYRRKKATRRVVFFVLTSSYLYCLKIAAKLKLLANEHSPS